jgi:hypothetical protein
MQATASALLLGLGPVHAPIFANPPPPLPLAIRSQGARWTPMVGNGGQGLRRKVIMSGSVNMTDRLAESMRVIRRGVEPWVASTDIL